jgi:hypothetical protein
VAAKRATVALAAGLFALAAGLAVVAVLGPLVTGVIDHHVGESLRNLTIGLDALSLVGVAPIVAYVALMRDEYPPFRLGR